MLNLPADENWRKIKETAPPDCGLHYPLWISVCQLTGDGNYTRNCSFAQFGFV